MAYKYPYVLGAGGLTQTIQQLRKIFPPTVNADTLKRYNIAPNNEGYVINTLRFIKVIDEEGNKAKEASSVFSKHDNDEFAAEFSKLVKEAYSELFGLFGDESWKLEQNRLISFFRQSDESSDSVGRRQASTFLTLSALSGFAEIPATKPSTAKNTVKSVKVKKPAPASQKQPPIFMPVPPKTPDSNEGNGAERKSREFGLTVRIEINLPATADKATYDAIFKSLRDNLIDVE